VVFFCESIEETQKVAKKLAKKTPPGSVIALIGELGAGKTTFTKGFAIEMGVKDPVTSPTFKLVSEYKGKKYLLNHVDAYRMEGPKDFLNIGGEEYLTAKNSITIIEWGDLLSDLLSEETITVHFKRIKIPKESRKIEIKGIKID
tara:strand:+ start:451 stop:885 length:435 start_codon:yes stop_codon:yes gene_type:complete